MFIKQIVNNQFEINTDDGVYFQSYDSVVAFIEKDTGKVSLGTDYRYSRTTMKYLVPFLGEDSIKDVDKKVEDGTYKIDENLRVGDKEKYARKAKKIIQGVEAGDCNLEEIFDELKKLTDELFSEVK